MAPSLEVESTSGVQNVSNEKNPSAVEIVDAQERVKNGDLSTAIHFPVREPVTTFELEDHPVDAKPHIISNSTILN
jgi:hypothetical protein